MLVGAIKNSYSSSGSIIAATVRANNKEPINMPVPVSRFLFLLTKITNKYVTIPRIAISSIAPNKRILPIASPELIFSPGRLSILHPLGHED